MNKLSNKTDLPISHDVYINIFLHFLDCWSYVSFLGTSKTIRKLKNNTQINNNYIFDIIKIYDLIFNQNKNVFITGSAGTGKSYCLNKIYEIAKKRNKIPCMTASTGIASINLQDGRTLHSVSGLKKGTIPLDDLVNKLYDNTLHIPNILADCNMLIIDEFSMVGYRFFEKFNLVCKFKRQNNNPCGGLQLVLSGDFLQLPPVADKFVFEHDLWEELDIVTVELTYPFRQCEDRKYYNLLQRVRIGEPNQKDIKFLQKMHEYTIENLDKILSQDIKPTRIMSKQLQVKKINHEEFEKLEEPIEHTYTADDSIVEKHISNNRVYYTGSNALSLAQAYDIIKDRAEHQAPQTISFKNGAQYILTFNFDVKKRHVNGSRCVYKDSELHFTDNSTRSLDSCKKYFYYNLGNNLYLQRIQVALRLGYAVTIHSSQGLTLDCALVNLGSSIFTSAQAYVALSRIKNEKGLYLEDFIEKSIKTHAGAKNFMKKINKK